MNLKIERGNESMLRSIRFSKLSFVVVLTLVLTMIVSACGGGTKSSSSPSPSTSAATTNATPTKEAEKEPVKIKVWTQNRSAMDVMNGMVKEFNTKNKDIQIEYITQSDDFSKVLTLALQTNQAPDIFAGAGVAGLDFIQNKWALPIEGLVDQKLIDRLHKFDANQTIDSKIYSLPTAAVTTALIYNKDLFRKAGLDPNKPPQTLSEVKEAAKKITEASKGEAFGFGVPLKWRGYTEWGLLPSSIAPYKDLSQLAYNTKTGEFQLEVFKPAVELVRDIVKNKWAFPGASSLDNDPMRSAFAEGKIGMFIGASWDVGVLNDQFTSKVDWAVAPVPVPDGTKMQNGFLNASGGFLIWSGTKYPKEAAKVFEFITGAEVSRSLQKAGKILALDPEAKGSQYQSSAKGISGFVVTDTSQAVMTPPAYLMDIKGETFAQVMSRLILTNDPVDSTLKDLSKRYNEAYQVAVQSGKLKKELFLKK